MFKSVKHKLKFDWLFVWRSKIYKHISYVQSGIVALAVVEQSISLASRTSASDIAVPVTLAVPEVLEGTANNELNEALAA